MRLYSRTGAAQVVHEGVTYTPGSDGGFDFPEHVGTELHGYHAGKQQLWETEAERSRRLVAEELERRKDPATLLDAVQQLVAAAQTVAPEAAPAAPKAPRTRKGAAAAGGA